MAFVQTVLSFSPVERNETILVWGGSTCVGSNAIQLARCAGYRVVATASAHNFEYLRSLGTAGAVDFHNRTVIDEIVENIGNSPLAVTVGSLGPTLSVVSRTTGSRRIAAAFPGAVIRVQTILHRRRGIQISSIWGGTLKDNEVGPGIYVDFLPAAIKQLQRRVSATKLVVTI